MQEQNQQRKKILSRVEPEDFTLRDTEFQRIVEHLKKDDGVKGLLLLSEPANGASELLFQAYDQLFFEQGEVLPFYFDFNSKDRNPRQAARRFLQSFLIQIIAFRRNDPDILKAAPEVYELTDLALPSNSGWLDHLVAAGENRGRISDKRSFVRQALSAPLRALANGVRVAVMIDNFHHTEKIKGDVSFLDEVKEIYGRSETPFIFSGRRRFVLNAAQTGDQQLTDFEVLRLDPLTFANAGIFAETVAARNEVEVSPQTRDLIACQSGGNPYLMETLAVEAGKKNTKLTTFSEVEKVYVDSIFSGKTGKFYDSAFEGAVPSKARQTKLIGLLYDLLSHETSIEADLWQKYLGLSDTEFYSLLNRLHVSELIRLSGSMIDAARDNETLSDYIKARYRLEVLRESRALVVGDTLADALKRAPYMLAKLYRSANALGLREILSIFNCQNVSESLFSYEVFKHKYKGREDAEVLDAIINEELQIELPQIVYTANCVAFYPPINQLSDEKRSAVALGFDHAEYTDENEVVWLAAEVDSKLEATPELTAFWCDRLEMAAVMCNFSRYKIWLVTPEGFSPEACEVLKERGAYGSSRHQVRMLARHLKAEDLISEKINANEYEMIVPMGEDTEIIAAHALEEIARKHEVEPKAINQIKTALVEACINANEHSQSPDRKIYQKFSIEDDKIVITISNRGIKLPTSKMAESAREIKPEEGRRGWGLKLMKKLMDEVKFEQVDDGARISMVKYIKK